MYWRILLGLLLIGPIIAMIVLGNVAFKLEQSGRLESNFFPMFLASLISITWAFVALAWSILATVRRNRDRPQVMLIWLGALLLLNVWLFPFLWLVIIISPSGWLKEGDHELTTKQAISHIKSSIRQLIA